MQALDDFVLTYNTLLFYPQYDDYGKLITVAIGHEGSVLVDMLPSELINFNLNLYGSSLEGAKAGAKAVLGKIYTPPIVVNKKHGLYWFQTKSRGAEDCVWIALHHVKEYSSPGKGRTKVVFTNGCSIELDISLYSFQNRVQRAYELKGKVENRTKMLENLNVKQQQLFYVSEETSKYAFKMDLRNRRKPIEYKM